MIKNRKLFRKLLWNNPNWDKISRLGKSLGFEWGGDWVGLVDKPHFQMTFGNKELVQLYRSGHRDGLFIKLI